MFSLDLAAVLGTTAGLIDVAAYALYKRQMAQSATKPNMATWAIWAVLCVLNSSSYLALSGHWLKALLPMVGTFACLSTGLYALYSGKFKNEPLTLADKVVMATALGAVLVWCGADATYGNLCLQLALVASFVPTLMDLWRNPTSERWTPWAMWASASALMGATVLLNWESWSELACPTVGLVLNGLVGCLSRR